jgi:hypothetical protein
MADESENTISEVGVRMKGNTSRLKFVDSDDAITQGCHFKISFKAAFDDSHYDFDQFK